MGGLQYQMSVAVNNPAFFLRVATPQHKYQIFPALI